MLKLYHNDMSTCSQKSRLCLAEKGLQWEDGHLDLRAGEHQKEWYIRLNPRAVVPTLIHDDKVIPESNVINEYLDEAFPDRPLMPRDPHGRAKVRLWTKQLDEGIHDAGIAILSFAIAFRHQYAERGAAGREMLEQIPEPIKRERRRDVIEKGLDSPHFKVAVARMELLLTEMEQALSRHPWLATDAYTLADAAYTPYLVRLEHLGILGMIDERQNVAGWYRRLKERPSFSEAIVRWENGKYLKLMKSAGAEASPRVRAAMQSV